MAVGDLYRFVRTCLVDGQTHVNVMHFIEETDAGSEPEQALLDAWDAGTGDSSGPESRIQDCMRGYTSLLLQSISAQRIQPTEGEIFARGIEFGPGTATDTGLPTFSQWKLGIRTTNNSRSGRGGIYIGAVPEGGTTGNSVTGGFAISQQGLLDSLVRRFTLGGSEYSGFVLGVYSRLNLSFASATTLTGASTLGTMRSRRVGRGT